MPGKMLARNPAQAMAAVTVMNQHGEVIHNGVSPGCIVGLLLIFSLDRPI